MINGIVICILALESISDLKNRCISGWRILAFSVFGIVLNFLLYYQSVWSIVGGVVVGIVLLLYAIFTKGAVGIGDGIMFVCLGIYLGLSDNMRLLFFSLIAAALAGGIFILAKKKSIKTQIPFMPCVLAAYILMTVAEVLK